MFQSHESLSETHLIGRRCLEKIVYPDRCPPLNLFHIIAAGHSEIRPPYRMVRHKPPFSHISACTGGAGRILLNGKWTDWLAGQMLLAPPGRFHAFECTTNKPWRLAWIFYREGGRLPPLVSLDAPMLVAGEFGPFESTIQMLNTEVNGPADASVLQSLVVLLNAYARRLAAPSRKMDERLWRLWQQVDANLGHAWTNGAMAGIASMSEEHLRRLCLRDHRQTPMERVFELRMQRATGLLVTSARKIDEIAREVGFTSIFSFSSAFKRWCGQPPSQRRG